MQASGPRLRQLLQPIHIPLSKSMATTPRWRAAMRSHSLNWSIATTCSAPAAGRWRWPSGRPARNPNRDGIPGLPYFRRHVAGRKMSERNNACSSVSESGTHRFDVCERHADVSAWPPAAAHHASSRTDPHRQIRTRFDVIRISSSCRRATTTAARKETTPAGDGKRRRPGRPPGA